MASALPPIYLSSRANKKTFLKSLVSSKLWIKSKLRLHNFGNANVSLRDSGKADELLLLLVPVSARDLSLADIGTGYDFFPSLSGIFSNLSDDAGGEDAVNIEGINANLDYGIGQDQLGVIVDISISDLGLGLDSVIIFSGIPITVFDLGTGADSVSSLLASLPSSDSAIGTDAISGMLVELAITETAVGADLALAGQGVADLGAGADVVTIDSIAPALADSGHRLEQVFVSSSISLNDYGNSIDALTTYFGILLTDLGLSTDSISAISKALASDIGVGHDIVSPIAAMLLLSSTGIAVEAVSIAKAGFVVLHDVGTGTSSLTALNTGLPIISYLETQEYPSSGIVPDNFLVSIDGAAAISVPATTKANGSVWLYYNVTGLSAGAHTAVIRSVDVWGVSAASTTYSFIVQ